MGKIVTVAQQKGGAGKTTLVAHLAVAWSQRGKRVAVIDIDPQGSLTQWHKLRAERYGEGYTGLTFASHPGWRVSGEVSRLKRQHDVILIDSPPHVETDARAAIRAGDLILLPVQPSPTDLWATKATLDLVASERLPALVILNRYSPNSKLAQTIMAQLPHLAQNHLGNRVLFASALLEGRTATETAPNTPAALEIKALAEEIGGLIFEEEAESAALENA